MTNAKHWNRIVTLPVISFTEKLGKKRRPLEDMIKISTHKGFKAYQTKHVYKDGIPTTYINMCRVCKGQLIVIPSERESRELAEQYRALNIPPTFIVAYGGTKIKEDSNGK